jgi:hypothetical protein
MISSTRWHKDVYDGIKNVPVPVPVPLPEKNKLCSFYYTGTGTGTGTGTKVVITHPLSPPRFLFW